ncbi:zinc finger protein 830-like isoform X2 [Papaver somniferum]|uniref:zinc finger protein 830-like isoform X2 n=1 Tax=Papaver somniferum TaxID=3469 RepID=UPI000E6FDD74|nr:zinc finger protein 830-like isoform X2 [Papaver somniferum]
MSSKALYRSKLKEAALKRDKRIDSALVRYNESDQPVCRVCEVVLKSESQWAAHQASRKHHDAIKNIRATAAAKSMPPPGSTPKTRTPASLPEGFFDKNDPKRQKTEVDTEGRREIKAGKRTLPKGFFDKKDGETSGHVGSEVKPLKKALPENFFDNKDDADTMKGDPEIVHRGSHTDGFSGKTDNVHAKRKMGDADVKQVKGALPMGFFDDKEADLRAHGIQPVKVDPEDKLKEFEKSIQEDVHEVDERMVEEEIDAAEIREGEESLAQKEYRERVEKLKKKQLELKAARLDRPKASGVDKSSSDEDIEESSSDSDDDDVLDWRKQGF